MEIQDTIFNMRRSIFIWGDICVLVSNLNIAFVMSNHSSSIDSMDYEHMERDTHSRDTQKRSQPERPVKRASLQAFSLENIRRVKNGPCRIKSAGHVRSSVFAVWRLGEPLMACTDHR